MLGINRFHGRIIAWFLLTTTIGRATAQDIQKYSFPLPTDLQRADVYAATTVKSPTAVLVLCPGCNRDGGDWLPRKEWQDFAKTNNLGLAAISFASDVDLLMHKNRGYYYASQGSGQLLLGAIHKIYGRDLPILLYGFSAGAQFTSRFVMWKPDRVTAWCAYSAGWWDKPSANLPPGIISCGEDDERNGATFMYFLQGRALGNQWLWINLPKTDHVNSTPMEKFARQYFTAMLNGRENACWVDIGLKKELSADEAKQTPAVSAWLPDRKLLDAWSNLHEE